MSCKNGHGCWLEAASDLGMFEHILQEEAQLPHRVSTGTKQEARPFPDAWTTLQESLGVMDRSS